MTCEELRAAYLLHALGVLEEPEQAELRAHLDRDCETCAAGMREARMQAFGLGAGVEGPEPSRELRGRILAAAGGVPQNRLSWWAALLAAAAMALAAVVFIGYQARSSRARIAQMQIEVERSGAEAAALREALELIQAPDTREVSFGQSQPAPPRGRVFFSPGGVLMIASRLPAPPTNKTYEMWIIPRGGKPAPAGLFRSSAKGNAIHLYRPPTPPTESDTVAVTLEAAAGADAPTSTPVIVAPL
jgi:hypothetical protein